MAEGMDALETKLGMSLDDLIKQQQAQKKSAPSSKSGSSKARKSRSRSAPKVLKAAGGVSKAKTSRRNSSKQAPLAVDVAGSASKTKRSRSRGRSTGPAVSTSGASNPLNIKMRSFEDASKVVQLVAPLMEKAHRIIENQSGQQKNGRKAAPRVHSDAGRSGAKARRGGNQGGGGGGKRGGSRRPAARR